MKKKEGLWKYTQPLLLVLQSFLGTLLVEELSPDIDHEFRLFWVACPELQKSLVVVANIRDAREGDPVVLSLHDLFNVESHLVAERVIDGLELEGLVEVSLDVYASGDGFASGSIQENHPFRHHDRRFDQSLDDKCFLWDFRIVGVDPGGFSNSPVVSSRIDSQGDFPLPSRGDGPVEVGHRAASPGIDVSDFKQFVAFIQDLEGVFNHFPLLHVSEIKRSFRKEQGGS